MKLRNLMGVVLSQLALAAITLAGPTGASAYTLKTLYSFCAKAKCPRGANPNAGLLMDGQGNLFGTTTGGGKSLNGTIFEVSPAAKKTKWRYKSLVSFNGRDGDRPDAALIADTQGNLYGTTFEGGKYGSGAVFELVRGSNGGKRKIKVLYSFCNAIDQLCTDGQYPEGGLTYAGAASGQPYDGHSPLFGSTNRGGVPPYPGAGTVFELALTDGGKWKNKVIHAFCSPSNCPDGVLPSVGGVVADVDSNIFGTTKRGGQNNGGALYELTPDANKSEWTATTVYGFCALSSCADGAWAEGALLIDSTGSLFGLALEGGNSCADPAGCGVAFKVGFTGGQAQYSTRHVFCGMSDCTDGRSPLRGLIMDSQGDLFGATNGGGGHDIDDDGEGGGTIFELNNSFKVLYSFCALASCADGAYPVGSLVRDASGNLFGVTFAGGASDAGTVFELMP